MVTEYPRQRNLGTERRGHKQREQRKCFYTDVFNILLFVLGDKDLFERDVLIVRLTWRFGDVLFVIYGSLLCDSFVNVLKN